MSTKLHTPCDSDVALAKQQRQEHTFFCHPCLLLTLLGRANSNVACNARPTSRVPPCVLGAYGPSLSMRRLYRTNGLLSRITYKNREIRCGRSSSVMRRDISKNTQNTALDTNSNPNPNPNPNPDPAHTHINFVPKKSVFFLMEKNGRPHYNTRRGANEARPPHTCDRPCAFEEKI